MEVVCFLFPWVCFGPIANVKKEGRKRKKKKRAYVVVVFWCVVVCCVCGVVILIISILDINYRAFSEAFLCDLFWFFDLRRFIFISNSRVL